MNGVLRLIQNELIKVTRQLSWRIMAIIILLIAAGLPLLSHLLSSNTYRMDMVERASQSPEGSIEREYYNAAAEADKYFKEKGYDSENWQYSSYYYSYLTCCTDIRGLELIADEGKSIEEVMDYFGISEVIRYDHGNSETEFLYIPVTFDANEGRIAFDPDAEEKEFTREDAKKMLPEFQKQKEYLQKAIDTPFSQYIKDNFGNIANAEQLKADFELAKAEYEKNPDTFRDYDAARLKYESGIILSDVINELLEASDNLTPREEKNRTRLLQELCGYVDDFPARYAAEGEEMFNAQGGGVYCSVEFSDYGEYSRAVNQMQAELENARDILVYAVRNDISIPYLTSGSVRNDLQTALNINMSVLMFFAIFMAAVTVSSEHSSGAIRLLLIRPRSRWKILLSKLVCLFILLLSMTVLTSLISFGETAALNGWGDLSMPYLIHNGSGVTELPPLLYYIFQNCVNILPSLLIMFFALFMSVLTKRSVFALAISFLANVFGGAVSELLYGVVMRSAQWLKLTPIPYFDLGSTFPDSVRNVQMFYRLPQVYGITLGQGAIMMGIYSVVIAAVTFVIFKKQQIK